MTTDRRNIRVLKPKENLSENIIPENSFVERVNKLFQNSKVAGKQVFKLNLQEKLGNVSPFLQKKLDALSTSRHNRTFAANKEFSFYEKYNKEWKHPKNNSKEIKILSLILEKLVFKRTRDSMRKLEKTQVQNYNPLAFTKCSHCNAVALTLLTSSTKEELSPRFHEKILQILPSKPEKLVRTQPMIRDCNITTSCAVTEHNASKRSLYYQEGGSPEPKEIIHDNELSLVMYSEDQIVASPRSKKKNLSDMNEISEIKLDFYESSLDSPGIASSRQIEPKHTLRFNESIGSKKPKEEASFEFNPDITELPKGLELDIELSLEGMPKSNAVKVPKLDFSELLPPKPPKQHNKNPSKACSIAEQKKGLKIVDGIFKERLKLCMGNFKKALGNDGEQSLTFDFSKEEIQNSSILHSPTMTGTFGAFENNRKCNLSVIEPATKEPESSVWFEYPTPSQSQKTAYKICHARLEKFIYRRKMQAFFCLSDFIYNMPFLSSTKRK
ncbi:unnamed protein product [Blepharisma stoltei]|uniref:Uncharacterized protein n=1 Tax=Blepharisma stoltei TaxID=1481888 RepID=A0AAU9IWS7_9CILI|nr:unnamed protein product [Blepharisma stoltei]